ncbi:MAG TPA: hypothetical protein VF815_13555 [Myxococcaceae bacterium]|jgi:tetratricopeptide (TPR) repeat protein
MRLTVLLSLGGILLVSLPAHAELRGVALYERGDYVRARKMLTEELNTPGLSKEDQAKARLYLAAALFASGAEESASRHLEELAMIAPSFKVDPILFPPDFVALAEKARATAEAQRQQQEQQRLEAERLEKERREREEAEAQAKQPRTEEGGRAEKTVRLRPEVFGFMDVAGKSLGAGGSLTLGLGMVDLNARVLLGTEVGFGGEVGVLLGSGSVQPRLALRGTFVPVGKGGGAVVGLRLGATDRVTVLLDVGAEYFDVNDKKLHRSFVLSTTAGVGFDLL